MSQPNYRVQNHDVDQFTHAYMICALWSSHATKPDGTEIESLDSEFDIYDIAEPAVKAMIADCAKFQHDHQDLIKDDLREAGHCFWLDRNGHGSGFRDREWPGDSGQRLSESAQNYREVDLEIGDDGLIHQFPENP